MLPACGIKVQEARGQLVSGLGGRNAARRSREPADADPTFSTY
jgi:hypothetical protein